MFINIVLKFGKAIYYRFVSSCISLACHPEGFAEGSFPEVPSRTKWGIPQHGVPLDATVGGVTPSLSERFPKKLDEQLVVSPIAIFKAKRRFPPHFERRVGHGRT